MKRKQFKGGVDVKDADEGRVVAVFATLNVVDSDGDVTRAGAFGEQEVRISAYGHTSWGGTLPVGKGTIKEVGDEAILEGQFFMDVQEARDTFTTVKNMEGLQEWSYGFDILERAEGEFEDQQVQFLDRVKVYEVSPVLLGAGVDTRTLTAKDKKGMKLSEHIEVVSRDVSELVQRAAEVVTMRQEQGKTLGEESTRALAGLKSNLEDLDQILVEPVHDEADALLREAARFERARSAGR